MVRKLQQEVKLEVKFNNCTSDANGESEGSINVPGSMNFVGKELGAQDSDDQMFTFHFEELYAPVRE